MAIGSHIEGNLNWDEADPQSTYDITEPWSCGARAHCTSRFHKIGKQTNLTWSFPVNCSPKHLMDVVAHPLSSSILSFFHHPASLPFENCSMERAFSHTLPTFFTKDTGTWPKVATRTPTSLYTVVGEQKFCKGLTEKLGERVSLLLAYKNHLSLDLLEGAAIEKELGSECSSHWDGENTHTHTHTLSNIKWTLDPAQSEIKVSLQFHEPVIHFLHLHWFKFLPLTTLLHEGLCSNLSVKWFFWPLTLGCQLI